MESKKNSKKNCLTIIVAASENNAIGRNNKLIWDLPDDLQRFKSLTSGHYIIMGRKTFDTFPSLLPNRTHIVISNTKNLEVPDEVIVVNNILDAIEICKNDLNPYIIGGGQIYKLGINLVNKIELTRVHSSFEGDAFFPEFNLNDWNLVSKTFHDMDEKHDYSFTYETYEKK
jgi:dihydrofolate reductase